MAGQSGTQEQRTAAPAGMPVTLAENRRRKTGAAGLSLVSNTLLVLLKLGVGLGTGSIGVLSEALHSATDLLASAVAFFSVRASDVPPDVEHPYGHGKIESLSGLAEAGFIALAAAYIIYEAIERLRGHGGAAVANTLPGLGVMAFSALVNTALSWHLRRTAKQTGSPALEADGRHLQTDVITSLGVLVGLALVRLTGYGWFDAVTALLVAVFILPTAYMLAREAFHPLLDARLPAEEESLIREVLESDPRVLGYHKLRTRKAGSQRHADVHVQVDDNYTLVEAHDLIEELEDRIREALPNIHVYIHVEPYHAEMRHQHEAHGVPMPPLSETAAPPPSEVSADDRTADNPPSPPEPPASSGKQTGSRG
ncbi:MAG TPA: cation diffusion facilitator family transporter [Chthonomonadaceae bacterium]|nr:cation diffusion facilitator family transporter [Chthonomonadaceae bacterium]